MPVTLIVHPDGREVARYWEPGTRPTYRWLTLAIAAPDQDGGMIESVGGGDEGGDQAWANEEGRLFDLPANVLAMRLLNWPAPPEGWDAYDGNMGNHPGALVFSSVEEYQAAQGKYWSPVVGPVVFLSGFAGLDDEGDYVDREIENDTDLGTDSEIEVRRILKREKVRQAGERSHHPMGAA
jgi:hypothetical protein